MEVGPCRFCKGTIALSSYGGYYCEGCHRIFKYNGQVVNPNTIDPTIRKVHETALADYNVPPTPTKGSRWNGLTTT